MNERIDIEEFEDNDCVCGHDISVHSEDGCDVANCECGDYIPG